MGWLPIFVMAAAVLLTLYLWAGFRSAGLQLLGAALLVGIAGYAWRGSPDLEGKPTPPKAEQRQPDSVFALERNRILDRFGSDAQILDAADAMHRNGLDAYGIALVRGALAKRPNSAALWIGMGNAMALYAGGFVTPAAELAFRRAAALAPDSPAPAYFWGLAYAQSGQFEQARVVWSRLLGQTPADAPWRRDIEQKLAILEAVERR
jgi:tetratricopeptide (TPR) repeat protein